MAGFVRRAARPAVILLVAAGTTLAAAGCSLIGTQAAAVVELPQLVKAGQLTVCTSLPYEPFEFEKDGVTVGFDVDLATEVAKKLKLTPTFLNEDFDAIESGDLLNNGTCDVVVAGLTITGERARVVDFSSPYFNAAQALVVRDSSSAVSLADLAGQRVAVQKGTTAELYVNDNAPASTVVVPFEDPSAMGRGVASGEVAAAVYDNTVVGDVLEANPGLAVAAEFDTGEQYGMAVKKNANVNLLRVINDVLAESRENGRYDAIYRTWFGAAPQA